MRRAAETDALRASRAKSRFLATMSHELRTPLNAIIGYTELVQDEVAAIERDDLVDDLDRVRVSADHLLRMVSDVLDLSRIEAGELTIEPLDIDVGTHLLELQRLVDPTRRQSGSELHIEAEPGLFVHSDPSRLAQISINLVTNALKFTSEGTVWVRARRDGSSLVLEVEEPASASPPTTSSGCSSPSSRSTGPPPAARTGSGSGSRSRRTWRSG